MPVIKQIKKHKLLLDTHVLIWLSLGTQDLSKKFLNTLEKNNVENNIFIAPISIWEIGMLVEKKRINLDMDRMDWIERMLQQTNISLAPFTPRIAIQSTRLPNPCHGDPADRILIATARELNALLVTHDQKILTFGKNKFISVYDPTG